ncbi:unnamed protein product [Lupinus luteus]|uniref:Uncharacterized protein n=1 Tax=Lupinus luteus TaxID=3873 RepID=A0AAV1W2V0_LUPLU
MDLVLLQQDGKEVVVTMLIFQAAIIYCLPTLCKIYSKIIGAKYFKADGNPDPSDILSPIDVDGHGTHTASTAAGNPIQDASLFGLANGTARGAVPSARLAIYKVCWSFSGCADMDILAAFDAAIHDGVDVISISIGGGDPNYVTDSISIGAFFAMRKGIITVASAGNGGPSLATVTNTAPWIVTVAASAIDRAFKSTVQLGSGKNISGTGVSCFNPERKLYPLVNGIDAARDSETKEEASYCYEDSLDPNKVKGKLVYCKLGAWGTDAVLKEIGGVGTILESGQYPDVAQIFMAPTTIVNDSIGAIVTNYIKSTRSPSAVIYKSHEVKIPAPVAATFSSRGPNPGSQHILKPDVAAPGIDILASYTLRNSLTAKPMSKRLNNEAEFAYGSGQLNPARAISPGLVYDMDAFAYIQFLCHEGYNGSALSVLVGSPINCSSLLPGLGYDAINYPNMQLILKSNKDTIGVFRRTVTNVGTSPTIYNAKIRSPKGVEITVKPSSLIFCRKLQKKSFTVVVKAKSMASMKIVSGSLIWKSPLYFVRSPIVIYST